MVNITTLLELALAMDPSRVAATDPERSLTIAELASGARALAERLEDEAPGTGPAGDDDLFRRCATDAAQTLAARLTGSAPARG